MSINFWDLLHQRQDELTKSGRAVADYLLQHADEAQYLSISSLAKECNVAEATVFRFCRALGFEGYHEMRIALAQANATGSMVNHQELQPGATTATLCDHAHALFMTAINGTQNALSTEAVDEAANLMRAAKQVFCFGQGGSMLLANDICARFSSLSTNVVLLCGAQESPLDSGSIPIKVAVLYVGEVLLLRYMMDDPETANTAQDRTSEAVAMKLL